MKQIYTAKLCLDRATGRQFHGVVVDRISVDLLDEVSELQAPTAGVAAERIAALDHGIKLLRRAKRTIIVIDFADAHSGPDFSAFSPAAAGPKEYQLLPL